MRNTLVTKNNKIVFTSNVDDKTPVSKERAKAYLEAFIELQIYMREMLGIEIE